MKKLILTPPPRKNFLSLITISFLFLLLFHTMAQSQWQYNGDHIYNENTGNVGIGILDPQYKLDISGTLNAARFYKAGVPVGSWLVSSTNQNNILYNDGNVGIGTDPVLPLHIKSSINWPVRIENPNTGTGLTFQDINGMGWISYYGGTSGYMDFFNKFRITNTGNVGINNANPNYLLDVNGSFNSQSLNTGDAVLGSTTITGNTIINGNTTINGSITNTSDPVTYPLRFNAVNNNDWGIEYSSMPANNRTEFYGMGIRMRDDGQNGFFIKDNHSGYYRMVFRNGKIGIGNDNPQYKLDVNGTINAGEIMKNGQQLISSPWLTNGNKIYYNTDNVGISTNNPQYKLDVNGTINASDILKNGQPLNTSQWTTNGQNIYFNGSVGIGTNNPMLPLHVSTGIQIGTDEITNHNFHFVSHDWSGIWGLRLYSGNSGSGTHLMTITNTGNIGIGTPTPNENYKLSVNGNVRAKEIKVEANWSDFVFKEGYNLRTINEVEQYIADNGHLPDIPSESEVKKDGVNVGDMASKLLQKIEELTLYIIEQEKKIEELEEKSGK